VKRPRTKLTSLTVWWIAGLDSQSKTPAQGKLAAVATLCSIFPSDDGIHLLAHSELERVKGIEPS
jgi:hypothetical protein